MKKILIAAIIALLAAMQLPGAEKLLRRVGDYTLDTKTHKKPWKNVYSRSFYFPGKLFDENRGKEVEFRADWICKAGSAPLRSTLRICTNPGNKLRVGRAFPQIKAVPGKKGQLVCRFTIPDLDGMVNPNIQIAFLQNGSEHCAWELKNIRLVLPDSKSTVSNVLPPMEPASAAVEAAQVRTPLELVKGGKALFAVVIPDKKSVLYEYTAEELQSHFKLVTGATVPVVRESGFKGGKAIYVGETKLARKYGVAPSMLPPEHFSILRSGERIFLTGGDAERVYRKTLLSRGSIPVGTLYAAYEFIERVLGVRWFWPGKLGTYAPFKKEISVNRLHVSSRPADNTRTLFYEVPNDPDLAPGDIGIWHRRCRFGGSVGSPIANHSFRDWHKKFSHKPEFFALQPNGERKVNAEQGVHLCFRNPEVLKEAVKEKISELKQNYDRSIFAAVMTGDSNLLFHCRCKLCINDSKPERGPNGIHSDAMWGFVNEVAREVGKVTPGFIKCCAYGEYREPPSFPLEPNVAVTLCLGGAPHGSKLYREQVTEVLNKWKKSGAALYRWEYWNASRFTLGVYGAPAVYPRQLKELFNLDRGIVKGRVIELCNKDSYGVDTRNWTDWIYDVQNLYIGAKLMWDPDTDVEQLLDQYYDGFFGPAGKLVRQFHDEMELAYLKHYDHRKGEWNYERVWQVAYPAPFVDRMMGLLRKAVAECKGKEPYAGRAAKLLKGYLPFERNSRIFRKSKKSENPLSLLVPVSADGSKSITIGNFADSYNTAKSAAQTAIKISSDGKNITFDIACTIPAGRKDINWGKKNARDSYLWENESVELFFYGGGDDEYFQFILGPDNALSDFFFRDIFRSKSNKWASALAWNCPGVKYSTSRNLKGWNAKISIPLKSLALTRPMKEGSFRVNFCRNHYYRNPDDRKYRWEQSCWQPTYGSFSNLKYYGTLKFR